MPLKKVIPAANNKATPQQTRTKMGLKPSRTPVASYKNYWESQVRSQLLQLHFFEIMNPSGVLTYPSSEGGYDLSQGSMESKLIVWSSSSVKPTEMYCFAWPLHINFENIHCLFSLEIEEATWWFHGSHLWSKLSSLTGFPNILEYFNSLRKQQMV